jgi:hypothetical protein
MLAQRLWDEVASHCAALPAPRKPWVLAQRLSDGVASTP